MADKIVNPAFPGINHELAFHVDHNPAAYSVDRSEGANPIRQTLANLNEAGQLYGAIIYDKAPIMMRQLEAIVGEDEFRAGLATYLGRFSYGNATWPELIAILDERTEFDLAAWSDVWVNQAGRPDFSLREGPEGAVLVQQDPRGEGRSWPQRLALAWVNDAGVAAETDLRIETETPLPSPGDGWPAAPTVFNADGYGYGRFPAEVGALDHWTALDDTARAALLINLRENLLAAEGPPPAVMLSALQELLPTTDNQLLLGLMLGQASEIFWRLLPAGTRGDVAHAWETAIWERLSAAEDPALRRQLFLHYAGIALTQDAVKRVTDIWSGEEALEGVSLSIRDRMGIAQALAIKQPALADEIVQQQASAIDDVDLMRRWEFIAPSLSPDQQTRDEFFESLRDVNRRDKEAWVAEAVANLHHPLRVGDAERYLLPTLELLQEIQVTGDIFFPTAWLSASLRNHRSSAAVAVVRDFLAQRPDYNPQLRMKILQAADPLFRANRILAAD